MARPGNEPAKCRLTAFPYYHGMLLEPVDLSCAPDRDVGQYRVGLCPARALVDLACRP